MGSDADITSSLDPTYALLVMNEIPEDGGAPASPIFMNKGNLSFHFNSDNSYIVGGWLEDSLDINIDSLYISDLFSPYISTLFSRDNQWKQVPATLNSIKESNVESKGKEVLKGDILVDTDNSRLAEVKKISDQIIITQTPVNPIASSFDISTSVENYAYIDISIKPDFSSIDSSIISYTDGIGFIALLESPGAGLLVYKIDPKLAKTQISGIQFPFYVLFNATNGTVLYIQCEDIDINNIRNSSLFYRLVGGRQEEVDNALFNEWYKSHLIQDNGDIYKVKLNTAEDPGHAITAQVNTYFYDNWKSFISLDGLWKDRNENTVKVFEYDDLKSLNNSYDNLSDTPIINIYESWEDFKDKSDPMVYTNKYLCFKDKYEYERGGLIVFCDGSHYYPITGKSNYSVNIITRDGLRSYNTSRDDTSYSTELGLTDVTLSDTPNNYSVFAKRGTNFGWITPSSASIQAGSGISVSGNTVSLTSEYANRSISSANSGMYVMARDGSTMSQIGWSSVSIPRGVNPGTGLASSADDDTADTISLSQEVQDKLARIPDLPTGDGNYALTCTISGGVPTFAWTLATN